MFLNNLLKFKNTNYNKIPVEGISFDSRKVKKNYIFFAIKGNKTTGLKFINEAISRGASVIVSNKKIKNKIPLLLVKDVRKSLSEASSKFYNKKPRRVIAVTGTNGKSSVANFFCQILNLNNISSASIGTLGIFSKKYKKKTNLTSLDPLSLHKNLEILKKNKVNNVIIEASSHGLDQKRLDNLKLYIGIFTNLSHDHLDYHKTKKLYLNSKMHLFKNLLKKNSKIITDEQNKEFTLIKKIAYKKKLKKITIGYNSGNLKVLNNRYIGNEQLIKIIIKSKIYELKIPLIGFFQIKNLLMAILAAKACGVSEKKIFNKVNKIKPVPGRLECVSKLNNKSLIILDFAHTPDALEQSLIALKKQFKKKILLVFGCGGERDKNKRFTMGSIAKKYCKKIFITDDNPRNEDPKKIRKAIITACKDLAVEIGNRKKAIETAIQELESNEILLVAGKGHETNQDYGDKVLNFSDKKAIKEIIKKRRNFYKKRKWNEEIARKVFKNKKINYNGVSINSKTIKKKNLFFAIKGTNVDGHDYAKDAIKKGAIKSVISKKIKNVSNKKIIKVKNTLRSLSNLAKVTRNFSSSCIIGITGSVGKTTLKNLLSFALRNYGKSYHSPYSYNNKFGVPVSLANLRSNTNYGVFEIGMSKKGEINKLSKIVEPEIGIITNISEAHIENFKNLKDVAKAKSEIIDNILKDGHIILNKDGKFFKFLSNKAQKKGIKVNSFSSQKKADVSLESIKNFRNYFELKIIVENEVYNFKTSYATRSFIENFLACITTLYVLNLDLNLLKEKFVKFALPSGRGDIKLIKNFNKKFKFIDESYNASPLSMRSAIQNINSYKRKNNEKKLVFLGDMLELGKKSKKCHRDLSIEINKSDIDRVFVYGKHIKETFNFLSTKKRGKIFNNLTEAYYHLSKIIHNNDLLMIKGSNATGLNQFSRKIKKGQSNVI